MWFAYAAAWTSTAAAVITGMILTGKWSLLWFMLIPLFINVHREVKRGDGGVDNEQIN